jgi:predicted  nucleic acid-binding Zn-ribbon protein
MDRIRRARTERRAQITGEVNDELLALYERQRTATGVGAGMLQGRRCGACRIEIDRGQSSQIAAAEVDEVVRCPECGAILLRLSGTGGQ